VPFYLKEVAYRDIVRIKRNPAGYREFEGVERRSGCSVYRLLVHDATRLDEVQEKLLDFGVFLERDDSLIAIAVPPDVDSDALIAYSIEGKRSGFWVRRMATLGTENYGHDRYGNHSVSSTGGLT
jgi:hypothetical protein